MGIYFSCLFFPVHLQRQWSQERTNMNRNYYPEHIPIYLSCLFFSSALLWLHWRKTDKKNLKYAQKGEIRGIYKHISFMSKFHLK